MDYKLLISKALEAGFSDFEIYANISTATTLSIFNGEVDRTEIKDSKNFTVRGIYNNKMAYLSFENEDEDLEKLIATLKANAQSLTTKEEYEIYPGDEKYPESRKLTGSFLNVSVGEKIDLLKALEKQIKAKDERIVNVPYCRYNEVVSKVQIVNSKGLDVTKENEYCYLILQAVAKENEQTQSAFEVEIALTYDELVKSDVANKVAEKAISKLNAKPVESKTYPVVFDNEAMADLFEVFTSFFSGEAAIKKLTPLLGKDGEKIFSEKITIIDDPLLEGSIDYEPFDDEGVACYKKEVVKDGVFKGLLHNLKTAKYFKTKTTGNGFKSGANVTVRGVNLHIAPGNKTQQELLEGIKEGLLITDLAGLHAGANPITGDFSAQSSGFLIEDGKITRPVNLIVVSGNFIKIMNNIADVGSDLKILPSGVGAPSIRFTGLPVSGK